MLSELGHFLIIVLAWIGLWGIIDGTITHFTKSYPIQMGVYGIISIIAIALYAWTTPSLTSVREGGRIVI